MFGKMPDSLKRSFGKLLIENQLVKQDRSQLYRAFDQ